jgi:hypothetical protein
MVAFSFALLSWFASAVCAVDRTVDRALDIELGTAPTGLDKLKLLPRNSDWTYDYFAQEMHAHDPGSVVNANAATFPTE